MKDGGELLRERNKERKKEEKNEAMFTLRDFHREEKNR